MRDYTITDLVQLEKRQEKFSEDGNFQDALAVSERILKIVEAYYSPHHPRLATCYNNISYLQRKLFQYNEAKTNILKAIKIIRIYAGKDNHELCIPLSNLGMICEKLGCYGEAEQHIKKALKLILEEYGPARYEVPIFLNNLGIVLSRLGKYEEAEAKYNSAINSWKSLKGPSYSEIAIPLSNLGDLYIKQNKYNKAESVIRKGLDIQKKSVPEGDHSLAPMYENLGNLNYGKGNYQKSVDFHKKALDIRRRVFGNQHVDTAQSINNIAMSLKTLGHYHEAMTMYKEALKIYETISPPDHPYISTIKNNMALVYESIGDYHQTESTLVEALNTKINALGPNHCELIIYYINLANLYVRKEDYQQALELCQIAENLLKRNNELDNQKWLNLYNTIATIYKNQGNLAEAEKQYKKCIQRYEESSIPDPDNLATTLNNLASLYLYDENYNKAEECFRRCVRLIEEGVSPDHSNLINPLINLAVIRTYRRNYPSALSIFRRISTLQQSYIDTVFSFTQQEEKLKFVDFISTPYLITLSAIFTHMRTNNPKAVTFAYETVLRRKGIVLNSEIRSNKNLQRRVSRTWHTVKTQDILNALPPKTALLDFVKIQDYDFSFSRNPWGLRRYIVFILRENGSVRMVDLGNVEAIDPCIREVQGAIRKHHHKTRELLQELNTTIFSHLEGFVNGIQNLIICPDGLINLVPFSAIIDSSGNYLVKRFTITQVTGSSEILATPGQNFNCHDQLVIMASPIFDHPDAKKKKMKRAPKQFGHLKGAQTEAEKIPTLVPREPNDNNGKEQKKVILTGVEATKEAVLNTKSPRILHIATHADFDSQNMEVIISAPKSPTELIEELVPSIKKEYAPNSGEQPEIEHGTQPLSQSYLAFSGANHLNPDTGKTDGLLSGLEVAGMQLQGTELVVLSACNTGLGDIMPGEGVSGLRRAFALAGARNLVFTLWPVNDQVTTILMETFYRNLLKMPPAHALRQAQLQTIKNLEHEPIGPIPFFWAPFIIQGGQALTKSIYDFPMKKI